MGRGISDTGPTRHCLLHLAHPSDPVQCLLPADEHVLYELPLAIEENMNDKCTRNRTIITVYYKQGCGLATCNHV